MSLIQNPFSILSELWEWGGKKKKIQFPLQKWSQGRHASENKARAKPPTVQKLDMGKVLADTFWSRLERIREVSEVE